MSVAVSKHLQMLCVVDQSRTVSFVSFKDNKCIHQFKDSDFLSVTAILTAEERNFWLLGNQNGELSTYNVEN